MEMMVLKSVGVLRDGKTVYPPIGQIFDFEPAEVKHLKSKPVQFIRSPKAGEIEVQQGGLGPTSQIDPLDPANTRRKGVNPADEHEEAGQAAVDAVLAQRKPINVRTGRPSPTAGVEDL